MTDGTRFTSLLWSDIADICAEVMRHPFIEGLVNGTLPQESFRYYLIQDAHYLRTFARVLALCAAKAPDDPAVIMFSGHAANALAAERDLHGALLAELGSSLESAAAEPAGPTTYAYTSFLLASTYAGSYGEAMGAVLPCYWIYAKVGDRLCAAGSPNPVYHKWIDAYGGSDFQAITEAMLVAMDRMGEKLSDRERTLVRERNLTAARYEWMFWDAGYRREAWPV